MSKIIEDYPARIALLKMDESNSTVQSSKKISFKNEEPKPLSLFKRYVKIKNQLVREFLAEILGTYILCMCGLAAIAQFVFYKRDNNNLGANFLSVNVGFGFGATLAILVVGKVSGAHLNPAVSFGMVLTGRMSLLRFLIYTLAQFIGAFIGALAVFVVYLDAFKNEPKTTYAGIFATYPSEHLSIFGGFLDQLIATSLLVMVVLAITDKKNTEIPHGVCAVLVGLTICVIGTSFAYNCGYAVNPARDFGPRLLTLITGFGGQTFSANSFFFWIPIIAPMCGSLIGSFIYMTMISNHWNEEHDL